MHAWHLVLVMHVLPHSQLASPPEHATACVPTCLRKSLCTLSTQHYRTMPSHCDALRCITVISKCNNNSSCLACNMRLPLRAGTTGSTCSPAGARPGEGVSPAPAPGTLPTITAVVSQSMLCCRCLISANTCVAQTRLVDSHAAATAEPLAY